MSESGEEYVIPAGLLREAREAERILRERSQSVEAGFLTIRTFPVLNFNEGGSAGEISNRHLMDFLSPVVRNRASDSTERLHAPGSQVPFKSRAGRVIAEFIKLFFDEIRKKICKTNRANFSVGAHMAAALTALAHWVADYFGIASELAKVSASAVLIFIAAATKGAFVSDHLKTYFLERRPCRHLRGTLGNGSIHRPCRPQMAQQRDVRGGVCTADVIGLRP